MLLSILGNGGAYTANKLHLQLPEMDLATIYRNLNLFVSEGVIREIRVTKGETMYELVDDDHQHAHCTECGKVYHVKCDKEKVINALDLDDFDVEDIEVYVKGKCKKD